jgi:hypothetical protein
VLTPLNDQAPTPFLALRAAGAAWLAGLVTAGPGRRARCLAGLARCAGDGLADPAGRAGLAGAELLAGPVAEVSALSLARLWPLVSTIAAAAASRQALADATASSRLLAGREVTCRGPRRRIMPASSRGAAAAMARNGKAAA